MNSANRLRFEIVIHAPAARVHELMLADASYRAWTAAFCEGSYYDGSWAAGSRIRFLAPNGDGMVAEIAANRPGEFVSIRHLGFVSQGNDDTTSDAVTAWAPGYENYTFEPVDRGTRLTVDIDVPEPHVDFMNRTWPLALARLKSICEA